MAKKTTTTPTLKKKTTTKTKKTTPPKRKKMPSTTARGAKRGKGMAVIAYFGILCLIPLITRASRKSPFVRFHTNQGLVLSLFATAWMIVWAFIWLILMVVILYDYTWIK